MNARRTQGFTVVEVLIVGLIVLALVFMTWNLAQIDWFGRFTVAPPIVANGTTGTFIYRVTGVGGLKPGGRRHAGTN